jgi:endonuclease/exonuclease/phosphatase family metal-dependent hydrolase
MPVCGIDYLCTANISYLHPISHTLDHMKNIFLITLFIFLSACASQRQKADKKEDFVRILSYNVKNCQGMDGNVDYKRIADIITRIDPAVVALQELDSATTRSKGVVVLNELARLTGMNAVYGASIDFQGGKYGIGILTKEKPLMWKRIPLPGREERRSLLYVELNKFVFGCTHFSLNKEDRLSSAEIVNTVFKGSSKPVIIAGDFNAVPASPVIGTISRDWVILTDTSMVTSPADNPRRCIDYILGYKATNRNFHTRRAVVVQEHVASDHLPVWAEVSF